MQTVTQSNAEVLSHKDDFSSSLPSGVSGAFVPRAREQHRDAMGRLREMLSFEKNCGTRNWLKGTIQDEPHEIKHLMTGGPHQNISYAFV